MGDNESGCIGVGILFGRGKRPTLNGYQEIVLPYNFVGPRCVRL